MPRDPIAAIVDANRTRKDFAAGEVNRMVMDLVYAGVHGPLVDVYRLIVKSGSDNFRAKSIQGIMPVPKGLTAICLIGHRSATFGPIGQLPIANVDLSGRVLVNGS